MKQRGFALLAYLAAHQLVAAIAATYIGLAVSGVTLVDKILVLKDHIQAESTESTVIQP